MCMENHGNGLKRREFLKRSSKFAAATIFVGLGSSKLFGALSSAQTKNSIPIVMLNNGITMPRLGFGTNTPKRIYRYTMCV